MTERIQPTQPLRTVFVGNGASIYPLHEKAADPARFQLVGMADIDPQAKARADAHNVPFFTNHHDLLAALKPELVVIMTPHTSHPDIAIEAMETGAHVLVEKPMAIQVADADAMIETARRTGRLLAVNFQHRARPEVRAAYDLIQNGALGVLQHINMVVVWPRSHKYFRMSTWRGTWNGEGGGVLLNQSPHNLDLICHLIGLPRRLVAWARTTLHPIETEDTVQAMFEWPNGAIGSLHVSTAESGQPERIEILGTAGRLEIVAGGLRFDRFDQDLREFFPTTEEIYSGPRQQSVETPLPAMTGSHNDIYTNVYAAIREGAQLLADGESARMSLEVANAITLSSRTDAPVDFPIDRTAYAQLLAALQAESRQV
ncbi:MAG TPA: Gfo/Idh/MocA family oxidoreductase [Chloroflexi bacterium]|nr:Gfo/Idh/MocA family oxidoreductase [Chloroflexota bacterium]